MNHKKQTRDAMNRDEEQKMTQQSETIKSVKNIQYGRDIPIRHA